MIISSSRKHTSLDPTLQLSAIVLFSPSTPHSPQSPPTASGDSSPMLHYPKSYPLDLPQRIPHAQEAPATTNSAPYLFPSHSQTPPSSSSNSFPLSSTPKRTILQSSPVSTSQPQPAHIPNLSPPHFSCNYTEKPSRKLLSLG